MLILTLTVIMALMGPGTRGQVEIPIMNETAVEVPATLPLYSGVVIRPWDQNVPKPDYMNPDAVSHMHPLLANRQPQLGQAGFVPPGFIFPVVPPPPPSACSSYPPSGLTQLLRRIRAMLPIQQIRQLIANSVAHDHHVRGVMAILQSSWLHDKVANIQQSWEYRTLYDYVCRALHLDPRDVWEFVKPFVTLEQDVKPVPKSMYTGRQGMRGLLQDIRDILPHQQLSSVFGQMMLAVPNLSDAVVHMMSPEFRSMVKRLLELPAYQEVREEMLIYGVPLKELKELVITALGLGSMLRGS